MICRMCQADGKVSQIVSSRTFLTTMHWMPELDCDTGLIHRHDQNIATTTWACSHGHEWQVTSTAAPCWCGWQPEEDGHDPSFGDGD